MRTGTVVDLNGSARPSPETKGALADITSDDNLGRAVRVRWIDSGMHYDAGWAHREEFLGDDLKTMECESVGLWMGESDHAVALGQTRDIENNNWMAAQIIWKPSILAVEWL